VEKAANGGKKAMEKKGKPCRGREEDEHSAYDFKDFPRKISTKQ